MARSDGDSWDLASGLGATATMVAAARALASQATAPIIVDTFAAPLVRAVGIEFFTRVVDGEIALTDVSNGGGAELQHETDSIAVRTRFFDDFFLGAARAGIAQSVILAAGLDARPYRLAWPPGSVVYELDQPKVIEFKTATMSALGAAPAAERRPVAVDLRQDWPAALRANGFDGSKPSAWSAECMLQYLPPEAQNRLFDHITELSAPGSQLATEYHSDTSAAMAERARAINDRWARLGCDVDLSGLFYEGERSDVVDYLNERGWQVTTRTREQLFADYGRTFPDGDTLARLRSIVAVTATLR
jgi:methyltransferase (TIGR00027 family)